MSLKLKDKEKLYYVIRQYGLTLFGWWILVFLLFAIPFFFMFWLFQNSWWGITLFILPIIIAFILIIRLGFSWKKNCLSVTSHRLIDVEQRGFFDKIVSDISYDQIEDVSGRITGMWGTIFGYGEVSVQTGNGKIKIIAKKIKQPIAIQEKINDLRARYVNRSARDFSGNTMEAVIDKLYELETDELLTIKSKVEKILAKRR